jgi:hypothetical protein
LWERKNIFMYLIIFRGGGGRALGQWGVNLFRGGGATTLPPPVGHVCRHCKMRESLLILQVVNYNPNNIARTLRCIFARIVRTKVDCSIENLTCVGKILGFFEKKVSKWDVQLWGFGSLF